LGLKDSEKPEQQGTNGPHSPAMATHGPSSPTKGEQRIAMSSRCEATRSVAARSGKQKRFFATRAVDLQHFAVQRFEQRLAEAGLPRTSSVVAQSGKGGLLTLPPHTTTACGSAPGGSQKWSTR